MEINRRDFLASGLVAAGFPALVVQPTTAIRPGVLSRIVDPGLPSRLSQRVWLVNVAGERWSVATDVRSLVAVKGVHDGAVYPPALSVPTVRYAQLSHAVERYVSVPFGALRKVSGGLDALRRDVGTVVKHPCNTICRDSDHELCNGRRFDLHGPPYYRVGGRSYAQPRLAWTLDGLPSGLCFMDRPDEARSFIPINRGCELVVRGPGWLVVVAATMRDDER